MGCNSHTLPSWIGATSKVDLDGVAISEAVFIADGREALFDSEMGFGERSLSAAGAAVLSAVLVNPLDVAKTRLQAQAAGVPYSHSRHHVGEHMAFLRPNMVFSDVRCSPSCLRGGTVGTGLLCPPDCFRYKGTMDVFYKVVRQLEIPFILPRLGPWMGKMREHFESEEGFRMLWRGTNAALALAIPTVGIYLPCYDIFRNWIEKFTNENAPKLTPYAPLVAGSVARSLACITCSPLELARTRMQAFKSIQVGAKPPGIWKTLVGILTPVRSTKSLQSLHGYRVLWTGVGAQLARDVPFSAIYWSTLEPIRRRLIGLGEESNPATVLGANFSAGFVAGTLAAAATCPLDVAKTRRQIEKEPAKALRMTTRQTLIEIWRDGGLKGLFAGIGPRTARAGPSAGIVVSFYEVVKYTLHERQKNS